MFRYYFIKLQQHFQSRIIILSGVGTVHFRDVNASVPEIRFVCLAGTVCNWYRPIRSKYHVHKADRSVWHNNADNLPNSLQILKLSLCLSTTQVKKLYGLFPARFSFGMPLSWKRLPFCANRCSESVQTQADWGTA